MLIFSVHDQALLPADAKMPKVGYIFRPTSESRVLDAEIYGSTWVTEKYVRKILGEAAPGRPFVRLPNGHCGYQDLYVLFETPDADPPPAQPQIDAGPEGFLDHFEVDQENDCVIIGGWSVDRVTREAPSFINVELNGEEYHKIDRFDNRPDVRRRQHPIRPERCGFGVGIPLSLVSRNPLTTVTIEAVSERGVRSLLFAGSFPTLHLRIIRSHFGV
jgi:hypothetical protein